MFLSLLHRLLVGTAHAASAGVWGKYCSIFGACGEGRSLIEDAAGRVAMIVLGVVGGGAVISVIVAGLRMTFSAGNDQGREQAKTIVQYAIMGLVLAVASWTIIEFVMEIVMRINRR